MNAQRRTLHPASLFLALVAVTGLALLAPPAARADGGEFTFSVGALLGDDLDLGVSSLEAGFDDSPLYGGRLGWYGWPLGVEGSVMYSPSGLSASLGEAAGDLDARLLYTEVNLLVILIPGPVSPFVTAGVGLHSIGLSDDELDFDVNEFGYNFGGGVKATLGPVGLRVDVRDHVTSFDASELVEPLEILIAEDPTLHNIEVSAGVSIRF